MVTFFEKKTSHENSQKTHFLNSIQIYTIIEKNMPDISGQDIHGN